MNVYVKVDWGCFVGKNCNIEECIIHLTVRLCLQSLDCNNFCTNLHVMLVIWGVVNFPPLSSRKASPWVKRSPLVPLSLTLDLTVCEEIKVNVRARQSSKAFFFLCCQETQSKHSMVYYGIWWHPIEVTTFFHSLTHILDFVSCVGLVAVLLIGWWGGSWDTADTQAEGIVLVECYVMGEMERSKKILHFNV